MSVPKSKRKESQFEVIKHFYRVRKDITDILLRDFGYTQKKSKKKLEKMFGGKQYEDLSDDQKINYNKTKERCFGFEEWFIGYQRDVIMDCIRKSTEYIFVANSIYPSIQEELIERRIYQDKAIGQCYRMLQEFQYTIETLPVDIQKYIKITDDINKEISLLKGWRKSDNKFKKAFSDSATNFANVNSNGNANNNDASNVFGVRPDFNATI